jgi:hypothetical protein
MSEFNFTRWHDSTLEHGYPVLGEYVERWWLPVVGPTAMCILRRVAADLEREPFVAYEDYQLAGSMGLSITKGDTSPFMRALHRLERFGLARRQGSLDVWAIRMIVPQVPYGSHRRFPEWMQDNHTSALLAAMAST